MFLHFAIDNFQFERHRRIVARRVTNAICQELLSSCRAQEEKDRKAYNKTHRRPRIAEKHKRECSLQNASKPIDKHHFERV